MLHIEPPNSNPELPQKTLECYFSEINDIAEKVGNRSLKEE